MKLPVLVVVGVLLLVLTNAGGLYKKVTHNYDPEARCLDGSPGIIYVHEGGDTKNIMLFFLGGGACG